LDGNYTWNFNATDDHNFDLYDDLLSSVDEEKESSSDKNSIFDDHDVHDRGDTKSVNGNSAIGAVAWSWTPESFVLFDRRKRPILGRFPGRISSDEEIEEDNLDSNAVDMSVSRGINNVKDEDSGTPLSDGKRFLRSNK
jgi:hypothetical protein